jgi:ABC-type transport system substrate-binding protein
VPPDPTIAHVASLWRVQLANAGIDVQLQPVDQATLDASTVAGQYQAALMVGFDDPHPDLYEPQFRGIPAEQPAFNTNLARYVNPVVTKAFADARQTHDVTRQVDDYRILQEQLTVDIPWLFLVQVRTAVVGSDRLRDVTAWSAGSGAAALGEEGATVSLAQIWLAP